MGWWKTAKVGDKVVYIGPQTDAHLKNVQRAQSKGFLFPNIGQVCTIKEIWIDCQYVHISLCEYDNLLKSKEYYGPYAKECGFPPSGLRPVQTKSTEASMKALRKHLTGKTLEVAE